MKKTLPRSCFSRATQAGAARASASATPVLIPVFIKYKAIPPTPQRAQPLPPCQPGPRRHSFAAPGPPDAWVLRCAWEAVSPSG